MRGWLLLTSLVALLVESGEGVNRLDSRVLAGTYRPISSQDAIDRRFNCVLRSFMETRRNCQFYGGDDFQQIRAMAWRARYVRKSCPKSSKTETLSGVNSGTLEKTSGWYGARRGT